MLLSFFSLLFKVVLIVSSQKTDAVCPLLLVAVAQRKVGGDLVVFVKAMPTIIALGKSSWGDLEHLLLHFNFLKFCFLSDTPLSEVTFTVQLPSAQTLSGALVAHRKNVNQSQNTLFLMLAVCYCAESQKTKSKL